MVSRSRRSNTMTHRPKAMAMAEARLDDSVSRGDNDSAPLS